MEQTILCVVSLVVMYGVITGMEWVIEKYKTKKKMKEIFLKDLVSSKWLLFKYSDLLVDLASELTARSIVINSKAAIETNVKVGNSSTIGDSIINTGVTIEDNVVIGNNIVVHRNTYLGVGVVIENGVIVFDSATLGTGVTLRTGVVIGSLVKISSGSDVTDKYYIPASRMSVTYVGGDKFAVGCEVRSITVWRDEAPALFAENNYTEEEQEEYLRIITNAESFHNKL